MATFTNRATLTYSGGTATSNTVQGTVNETLTLTKSILVDSYQENSRLVYILTLVNRGTTPATVTLSDDLGGYAFGGTTVYPLAFVEGSLAYFVNGVRQSEPSVTVGPPLVLEGVTVPAGANAVLVYEADVTSFAPLGDGDSITNTVTTVSGTVCDSLLATATATAISEPSLSITKALTPVSVGEDGALTYTFVIENSGSAEAVATDNTVLRDTFDPPLTLTSVTLNGEALSEGEGYVYDTASGEFATVAGVITVPAASYEQNEDGSYTVIPGRATLTVSGTVICTP